MKQKQMFDGKTFVALTNHSEDSFRRNMYIFKDIITNKEIFLENGSKWKCEVTLLDYNKINDNDDDGNGDKNDQENKLQDFSIAYIFRSGQKTIAIFGWPIIPYNSIGNSLDYSSRVFKLENVYIEEENLERLKKDELLAKQKKDEQLRIYNERVSKEKFAQYCINKFGQENGLLIAQGKIKIGMTLEMCKTAWGKPYDIYKTATVSNTTQTLYYGWKRVLYFVNDILIRIDE